MPHGDHTLGCCITIDNIPPIPHFPVDPGRQPPFTGRAPCDLFLLPSIVLSVSLAAPTLAAVSFQYSTYHLSSPIILSSLIGDPVTSSAGAYESLYEESPRGAASGLRSCLFWVTSHVLS